MTKMLSIFSCCWLALCIPSLDKCRFIFFCHFSWVILGPYETPELHILWIIFCLLGGILWRRKNFNFSKVPFTYFFVCCSPVFRNCCLIKVTNVCFMFSYQKFIFWNKKKFISYQIFSSVAYFLVIFLLHVFTIKNKCCQKYRMILWF